MGSLYCRFTRSVKDYWSTFDKLRNKITKLEIMQFGGLHCYGHYRNNVTVRF